MDWSSTLSARVRLVSRFCLDLCTSAGLPWACSGCQDQCHSLCLALWRLLTCPRVVFSSCVLPFFVRSGLGGNLWACWMDFRAVILPFAWSVSGSGYFEGT